MDLRRCRPCEKVSARARQTGRSESRPDAKAAHREPEQDDPDRSVRSQVSDIAMQPDRGEKAPPLAVRNRAAIHDSPAGQIRTRGNPMKDNDQHHPAKAGPMKNHALLENHSLPMPATVFRAVLFKRFLRGLEA